MSITWCVAVCMIVTFSPKFAKLGWTDVVDQAHTDNGSVKDLTANEQNAQKNNQDKIWLVYPGRTVDSLSALPIDNIRQEMSVLKTYLEKLDAAYSNAMVRQTDIVSNAFANIKGNQNKSTSKRDINSVGNMENSVSSQVSFAITETEKAPHISKSCESKSSKTERKTKVKKSLPPVSYIPKPSISTPRKLNLSNIFLGSSTQIFPHK